MAITKCDKGHFFDDKKYPKCPHCDLEAKKAFDDDNEVTVAKIFNDNKRKNLAAFVAGKDERTVSIYSSNGMQSPVVGWLVCTDGREKGRDYRIKNGRNFIGRAYQMDVVIADDAEISRDKHCSIVFDPKSISYSLVPGTGIVYLNGEQLSEPAQIAAYDKITLGKTTLQFVPYCKEGVVW